MIPINNSLESLLSGCSKEIWIGPAKENVFYRLDVIEQIANAFKKHIGDLVAEAIETSSHKAFGKGYHNVQRGYYCFDPLVDIIITNARRGRLVKEEPIGNHYSYWYDPSGRLSLIQNYQQSGGSSSIWNELLIYIKGYRIGITCKENCDSPIGVTLECKDDHGKYFTSQANSTAQGEETMKPIGSIFTLIISTEEGLPKKRVRMQENVGEPIKLLFREYTVDSLRASFFRGEDFDYSFSIDTAEIEYNSNCKASKAVYNGETLDILCPKKPISAGMFQVQQLLV